MSRISSAKPAIENLFYFKWMAIWLVLNSGVLANTSRSAIEERDASREIWKIRHDLDVIVSCWAERIL